MKILLSLFCIIQWTVTLAQNQKSVLSPSRSHVVKFSLYPFVEDLLEGDTFITIQKEGLISKKRKKITYNVAVDYLDFNSSLFANSTLVSRSRIIELIVRPQLRYYFLKSQRFNGVFTGLSPYLFFGDLQSSSKENYATGLSGLIGYQKIIKNKVSLELDTSFGGGKSWKRRENRLTGTTDRNDYYSLLWTINFSVGIVF